MLLESDTAIKVAHDIIHDAKEFVAKWPRLLASPEEVPEGYVDFEFSDGYVLCVPCAWRTLLFAEGAERPSITFKNGENKAVWKPGTMDVTEGAFEGLLCDNGITAGGVSVEALTTLDDLLTILNAIFEYIDFQRAAIRASTIDTIEISGDADVSDARFENLAPESSGAIDANLEYARVDYLSADTLITRREIIEPVLKMNAYDSTYERPTNPIPKTDAKYDMWIPFLPFDANANPINGFNNPLADNPFFPDWFYVCDYAGPWLPSIVWVPSYSRPSGSYWRDEDNLYWHPVQVTTTASMFGAPSMVYPPRCRTESSSNGVLPPAKADADGIVVTIKILSDASLPICITDTYTRQNDNVWTWNPGITRSVKGPCIAQYIFKRKFTEINGEIAAVEYQFLPLGDSDGVT